MENVVVVDDEMQCLDAMIDEMQWFLCSVD
jgi:hypothetical protein